MNSEIARLRAENERLRALASNPPAKPTPVTQPVAEAPPVQPAPPPRAAEVAYGRVSGAAWTAKNDGTSNLMRGIPILIVGKKTTNISEVIEFLKKQDANYLADVAWLNKDAERLRSDVKAGYTAEQGDLDENISQAKAADAMAIKVQSAIKDLSSETEIDRMAAFELERQLGDRLGVTKSKLENGPRLITGGEPSGADLGAAKTNVDGKFLIGMVRPGDYYLVSSFESDTLAIGWVVPIHVNGNEETTIDLDNGNAAYIEQSE
ncbi:MAG TPA: hypothetical protein VHY37_06980 [Tepidisphaeraceae bacterium]|jgi:hypothetical protein|nr:hypothetical protein [Tepidisphaeraceae bacterium]